MREGYLPQSLHCAARIAILHTITVSSGIKMETAFGTTHWCNHLLKYQIAYSSAERYLSFSVALRK